MNKILKNFARYLDNNNLEYKFLPNNNNMMIIKDVLQKNSSVLVTILIGCEDNETNLVQIYATGFGQINSITIDILRQVNTFNIQYKWFKFCIDEENGRISMQTDIWVENIDGNKLMIDMILGAFQIADDCYPQIMRLCWG